MNIHRYWEFQPCRKCCSINNPQRLHRTFDLGFFFLSEKASAALMDAPQLIDGLVSSHIQEGTLTHFPAGKHSGDTPRLCVNQPSSLEYRGCWTGWPLFTGIVS